MIDVRRLQILHAVAAQGSVTGAARALSYSGPAVSQQIAALEREVGMPLVERAGRGIRLTEAAHVLVGHADALLAQLDAAEADLAALTTQVAGRVRIAAFPSAAATLVPPAWRSLAVGATEVELSLVEMEPDESLPALVRREVDVAVAHEYTLLPRPLDHPFERRDLLDDPVLVAVPADHPVAGDARVPVQMLAAEPFLTPRRQTSCAEMTYRACGAAGFVPRVVAEATDFQVLLNLVAVGAGVALVPRLAAAGCPKGVRLVPPRRAITRRVFAVSRRGGDRQPAVRVLLDALAVAADGTESR